MRLPKSAHTSRPWRIHELAPDFRVEDVWALPTPGGRDDFPRLVDAALPEGEVGSFSPVVRMLFSARWKLGKLFGWDKRDAGIGSRLSTLRDRLPQDLLDAPPRRAAPSGPFTPLYELEDEWAAELGNRTVHAVMHMSWVPVEDSGGHGDGESREGVRYRGQMAVLVKPNGAFGAAYMAAIMPFRYLVVYPALMRRYAERWQASAGGAPERVRT
ncbi:DUF2867 domain-containing protein [Streptomyces coffeae]|uniref:DUF2867 domain-containing protein n=1 Tax=Streptomyces coffeae TaxID=621382 RepID=A0ABS1NB30_9ACTN|nr:DUF2867 domain-containing protein [Streptomyces coffeae]MBL1097279.1 DUF2867 domain-containing protein [Streptomyces coffeae]